MLANAYTSSHFTVLPAGCNVMMRICLSANAKFTFIIRVARVTVQFAGTYTHVGTARAIAQRR